MDHFYLFYPKECLREKLTFPTGKLFMFKMNVLILVIFFLETTDILTASVQEKPIQQI